MRPIQLTVRAFGPYAGKQVIDFRELDNRSLFLVHGPTGSGKTTVLDAICYALYGQPSGSYREGKHLRSDHAHPSDATEVTLDFSLGEKSYRVWRAPEQERAKKRGGGVTRSVAKATLWDRTGLTEDADEGEVLASKPRDVNEQIEQRLGFRSDQFRQVIMLPQGEFRELLMSKSDRREEIMEVLFATDFFRSIQDALKERANVVVVETKDTKRRQELVLEQANAESLDELVKRERDIEKEKATASKDLEKAEETESAARKLLEVGKKDADKLAESAEAKDELESLKKLSEEFQEQRRAVDLAGKAALLRKDDEALAEREEEVATAEAERDRQAKCCDQVSARKEAADSVLAIEKKKTGERKAAAKTVHRFNALVPKVRQLAEGARELDESTAAVTRLKRERGQLQLKKGALEKSVAKAREELSTVSDLASKSSGCKAKLKIAEQQHRQRSELEDKRDGLAEARNEATDCKMRLDDASGKLRSAKDELGKVGSDAKTNQQQLASAQTETAKLSGLESKLEKASKQLERREHLADLQKELKAAKKSAEEAGTAIEAEEEKLRRLRAEYDSVQSSLREGQAGVLAGHLVDGEACPVCGSLDHPSPARAVKNLPSQKQLKSFSATIEKQEASVKAAISEQQRCLETVSGIKAELKSVRKELGKLKEMTVTKLKSACETAETRLEKARSSRRRVELLEGRRDELADSDERLHRRVEKLEEELEKARESKQAADRAVGKLESVVEALQKELGKLKAVPLESTEENLRKAQEFLRDAQLAKESKKESVKALKALEGEHLETDSHLSNVGEQLTDVTKRQAKAAGIAEQLEAEIPDDLASSDQLRAAIAEAEELVRSLEKAYEDASNDAKEAATEQSAAKADVAAAKKSLRTAKQRAVKQRTKFKTAREAAGFKTRAAYEEACLQRDELSGLRSEIKTYDADLAAGKKRFNAARTHSKSIKKPDLVKLSAAVDEAAHATVVVRKRRDDLTHDLKQADGWQKDLRSTASRLKKLEKQYETVGLISDVANGKNAAGITFQRFVLGALLDDVLLEASERLRTMSKGRFILERARERSDRRRTGGLDLVVFDSHTGTNRPVQSLSGGESFLASLSLALGLADVVQAYSGGIHLETIFIDEGFGTLDAEALDLAIRTLKDLQSGGRLVGIISHVSELKEVVDARLEVMAGRRGSRAKFVI